VKRGTRLCYVHFFAPDQYPVPGDVVATWPIFEWVVAELWSVSMRWISESRMSDGQYRSVAVGAYLAALAHVPSNLTVASVTMHGPRSMRSALVFRVGSKVFARVQGDRDLLPTLTPDRYRGELRDGIAGVETVDGWHLPWISEAGPVAWLPSLGRIRAASQTAAADDTPALVWSRRRCGATEPSPGRAPAAPPRRAARPTRKAGRRRKRAPA